MELEILQELGLDERETKIYIALLKEGPTTVTQLSKYVDVVRTSLYDVLEVMVKKGFVTFSQTGGKKVFLPVSPKNIQEMLCAKQKLLQESMPLLESLMGSSNSQIKIEQFMGVKALKNIYFDMLSEEQDIYHLFNYQEYSKVFKTYFIQNFIKRRVEKKIKFKALIADIKDKDLASSNPKLLRDIKKLPKKITFSTTLFIYGNNCGFFTFHDQPVGILIKDKPISSSMLTLFNLLWNQTN